MLSRLPIQSARRHVVQRTCALTPTNSRPAMMATISTERRLVSTGSTSSGSRKSSGSWRGAIARLGLAGGALWLYSNDSRFREQVLAGVVPSGAATVPSKPQVVPIDGLPSAHDISLDRRLRAAEALARSEAEAAEAAAQSARIAAEQEESERAKAVESGDLGPESENVDGERQAETEPVIGGGAPPQGAFNEETGEINWDCPCLGGMAEGPCGDEFKEAFTCFVFSKEEQKGIECVDKFRAMQGCFRDHPDVYGDELEPEETRAEDQDLSPVSPDLSTDERQESDDKGIDKTGPSASA